MPMSSKAFLEATRARQAEEAQAARMARYDAHVKAQRAKKRLRNEMRDALDTHNKTLAGRARKSAARLAANPRTGGAAPRTADDETIKKAFAHFDKDGSGTIDVQELGGALQMVLGRRPAKEAIQKLFEIADEDGSGELDLREWTKVAKRGELVDKEILHPKYRLMMEIKRRRAGQRDASEAALAATAAQIEQAKREADATRQKWKDEEERRLRNSIEKRKVLRKQQLELKKKNDDMKRRDDKQRLKERKARKAKVAQDVADGVGHELYRAMEERARKRCLDAIIEATLTDVDRDFDKRTSTRANLRQMSRFYVGAREDLAIQQQRAAKARKIKEANKRAKPAWYASTTPKFDDVELKDQTVYTQPPQEILDAVQDGGFEDMSESDDDGAMPAELRKVRFVEDDLDAAATLLQNSQRRRTACIEVAQKRQINSAATLLQNSERRRTARVEVAQKRQKRDDSAATMLQGSVRRRNAKQEVSQRRRKRDDGAATLLQGSVRRRNARAEVERRRAATTEHEEWPAFGQNLIGAAVEVNVDGMWLRAEIVEVGAALADLDGANGVCVRFSDEAHTVTEEWHEFGSDEVRIIDAVVAENTRPAFGASLVGTYVQVHVAGAWLDAVVVAVEAAMADHDHRDGICIQYAAYPSADPEWHLYDSEDVLYRRQARDDDSSLLTAPSLEPREEERPATPLRLAPAPDQREWPAFGQDLLGSKVKVNVAGAWLRAEVVEVGAALAELEGANGVCIRFTDNDEHTESEEWHAHGSDEVVVVKAARANPRPAFGASLVGAHVQVHVAGAWLDAVVVDVEAAMEDHSGRDGICIQYTKYASADPEWHLYDSADILYRRQATPSATLATPRDDDSSLVSFTAFQEPIKEDAAATLLQSSQRRRTARREVQQRRRVRDDGAATMLQGSVRRRNAKQEVSQRRRRRDDGAATRLQGSIRRRNATQEVDRRRRAAHEEREAARLRAEADARRSQEEAARDDSAATMLQGSVRRHNAKQELSQRRQVRDDGAATKLQGSIRRRNAKQELSQRRQVRDDGAATMLQGSVRRRNAKQELSQRRQRRDDGAATMLQGSVRRRNAKQEVQQRRKVRDDGAATMLQGSVRRRNAKQEVQQRRQARDDAAAEAEAARRAEAAKAEADARRREFERQEELRQAEAEAELQKAREAAEARRREEDAERERVERERREADEARRREFEEKERSLQRPTSRGTVSFSPEVDRDAAPEFYWRSSDVAVGMEYLHSQGVEHRDLKALNVLLTDDDRCKVSDFGLSKCEELRTAATSTMGQAGTPAFMAPEFLDENVFSEASDVYSFAIVMWEIWSRQVPWSGLRPMQIMKKVDKGERPPIPAGMPAELRELMVRAWAHDAAERPTFEELAAKLKVSTIDLSKLALVRTLEGHSKMVVCVAVFPDGRRVVSGSYKTLKVWDVATGECVATLEGQSDWVRGVAISPDGRRVVSGSSDCTLRVWVVATGKCVATLGGHSGWVECVAISPDGRRVVSGSRDKKLKVWDVATGECVATLKGHSGIVWSIAISPDGRRVVSASDDNTLKVWDVGTGECVATLEGHSHYVKRVAVFPDGRRVVSASWDNTLKVWDIETGECLATLEGHSDYVHGVAVFPDGRRVVSASGDETLKVWDVATGKCVATLEGNDVLSVAVFPDGRRVVSGSEDKTLKLFAC